LRDTITGQLFGLGLHTLGWRNGRMTVILKAELQTGPPAGGRAHKHRGFSDQSGAIMLYWIRKTGKLGRRSIHAERGADQHGASVTGVSPSGEHLCDDQLHYGRRA